MNPRDIVGHKPGEILGADPFAHAGGMDAYVRATRQYEAAAEAMVPSVAPPSAGEEGEAFQASPARKLETEAPSHPSPSPRPILRPDGSLNLGGLWDRSRRAQALRKPSPSGRKPWIESPEPPLQPDYKLFPIKRKISTQSRVERLARRLGFLPSGVHPAIDDFGHDAGYEAAMMPLFEFLYRKWFRVQSYNLEHVPSEGRALLVANHANWMVLDAAMIEVAVQTDHPARREVRALVDRFTTQMPWLSTFLSRTGQVYGCPENAVKLLHREELVLVFPEGARGALKPYSERMRVGRFGRGFARIAILTKTPIIPVAVQGFEELHPVLFSMKGLARRVGLPEIPVTPTFPWLGLLGLVPPPLKCFIKFGRPILTDAYPDEAAEDETIVSRLAEKVRLIVQDLYEHLRVERSSHL